MKLSFINFNCMGLFSFDTLHGFFQSTNIIQRINKMGELLEKEKADVIALQEVHTYLVLNLLKMKMVSYPYVAYKQYIYGPRGGLVIFSKHPIESTEYFNYQSRGSLLNKSFVARLIRNGVLACKIKDKPLIILDSHLTPNMDYDYSKTNRFSRYIESQLKQLASIAKNYAAKGNTVLIGGDFNADKKSYLYQTFVDASKAVDVFAKDDSPTQHQEYYPPHVKVRRIDYIFLLSKHKATITATKHVFTEKVTLKNKQKSYLSDHIALATTVDLVI